jgi:S-formylglutathione hydrolase FrmB
MILRGDYRSGILHTTVNVQFLIPEKGSQTEVEKPYKVVYLLHGLHGNEGSWLNNSMLPYYGKKYNVIFVMPEAGRSFYCDLKYGRKYYTFITDELPQICKRIFNISSRREDTAVMGYSMGGLGSLKLALTKPEQYGFCGAISSACLYFGPILEKLRMDITSYLKLETEAEDILKDLYNIYGESLEYRKDGDILELVKNFPADKPKPKIYAVCGTEDNLYKDNLKFNEEMKETTFDFTFEEWPGGHDWYFFNEALKKTLEFWHK